MSDNLPACDVSGCTSRRYSRGFCAVHYRYQRYGRESYLRQNREYKKTKAGVISTMYSAMRRRVSEPNPIWRSYFGKEVLSQDAFIALATSSSDFHDQYAAWVSSEYSRRLKPTPDRIDPDKGYSANNIRFLPLHQNVARHRPVRLRRRFHKYRK